MELIDVVSNYNEAKYLSMANEATVGLEDMR